ncbi:uncharacterized protein LOC120903047 isoform X1 [Anopheles arabiensis]|uniref:Uncharacterized protein n=2 Tax=Anopheles arabiensis TaxID=7173 RepID=A0A6R5L7U4_ANOAR|nr:uncharacterized protein LOC120903047 isoform X1 [Anopheles arabiensis]XP_061513794.1 uncharacterized protein LOC133393322 isoform X1 [Anopheles gambiae]
MIVSEMLPELLFSVGGGMQDFSKDDLGLLSSSVVVSSDKDPLVHTHLQQSHDHPSVHQTHRVDDIKLTNIPDLLEPGDANKLEEPERDLYPWHTGSNIGSRFLRSSDDPLISGGTNDNPHDNELSVPTVSQSMCPSPTTPPPPKHRHPSVILSPELPDATLSPLPTPPKVLADSHSRPPKEQQPKRTNSAPRARRKGPLKLRFHHQALPQEYLDHYEATQNSLQRKQEQQQHTASQSKPSRQKPAAPQQSGQSASRRAVMERQAALEREERTNESVRSWLQKILELQKEGVPMAPLKDEPIQPAQISPTSESSVGQNGTPPKRIVSYTDLPYMGEITLENSKPRRGRKPKKADICHLIYKNYGTILPGTPSRELGLEKGMLPKGCSKSVASLLERRLTSSDERKQPAGENAQQAALEQPPARGRRKEEPLNLCVRESGGGVVQPAGGETFSVSSSEEDADEVFASSCPTPIITPSDISTDQALAANMKLSLPTRQSSSGSTTETPSTAETPPGYVYWSSGTTNGSLFAHPMSLYSPHPTGEGVGKLAEEHAAREMRSVVVSSNVSSPPISPNGLKNAQNHPLLVPKHISQLLKNEKQSLPNATAAGVTGQRSPPAQKRKRSAIFIPPVPAENSHNPATEVSICKFKFTGGAKPCLQEKKILSVDSGGNFRYYSGTGDKSMRGYEFFPRESLQQSSINATSTTGAFLNASGERIACDLPPPSLGLSNDLLQIPEFPTSPQPCGDPTPPPAPGGQPPYRPSAANSAGSASERRRRKTRRATQRESLEKTFKEKGFLIQTQQLQSAEGATYCKFRQLRKFTRYLFRSWKDYLPGELQQSGQEQQEQQHQHAHQLQDGELTSMILPTVITSGPHDDHTIDEESCLTSSTSSVRMETVEGGEHHRSTPPDRTVPASAYHRLRRSRRISSTSVTSQHVHSEALVIDTTTAYHHRHGSPSSVVE